MSLERDRPRGADNPRPAKRRQRWRVADEDTGKQMLVPQTHSVFARCVKRQTVITSLRSIRPPPLLPVWKKVVTQQVLRWRHEHNLTAGRHVGVHYRPHTKVHSDGRVRCKAEQQGAGLAGLPALQNETQSPMGCVFNQPAAPHVPAV